MKLHITTVLNYLDGIAIGVKQGLYDNGIVVDHLETIINHYVKDYLGSASDAERYKIDLQNYGHLIELHKEMNAPAVTYKSRWKYSSSNK